jgi:predicted RNA-binding protein with RPS1 domain
LVHISNMARARVPSVATVFEVGEQVKVIAIKSPIPTKYAFSTADLESESGLMLRDKQVRITCYAFFFLFRSFFFCSIKSLNQNISAIASL